MKIEAPLLRKIIEGALLAADAPLNLTNLARLFEVSEGELAPDYLYAKPDNEQISAVLAEIQADCEGRGYELKQVASGWRFQVVQDVAPWVNRLWEEKPQRYSRALLETLALIAYRQPITRGDIESIRGVAVSSNIIKTLSEREWVKVVGHRDVPGRPALYATTRTFLDYFNLKSLDALPSLKELQDLDKLGAELDLTAVMKDAPESEALPLEPRGVSDGGRQTNPVADATVDAELDDSGAENNSADENNTEDSRSEERSAEASSIDANSIEESSSEKNSADQSSTEEDDLRLDEPFESLVNPQPGPVQGIEYPGEGDEESTESAASEPEER